MKLFKKMGDKNGMGWETLHPPQQEPIGWLLQTVQIVIPVTEQSSVVSVEGAHSSSRAAQSTKSSFLIL